MYLPQSSIKAVLQGLPKIEDKPIHISDEKRQREFLEEWCKEIVEARQGRSAHLATTYEHKPYLNVNVEINVAHLSRYQRSEEIRLKFINDVLHLSVGYMGDFQHPIAKLDQVWHVVEGLEKKLHERSARVLKQQKIRDLKTRSVEAQVEDLAQRLQFAYQLTKKHTKLVLVVKLDDQRSLYVDIPLAKIQETLDGLETLIREVKELYIQGLRFKIAQSPYGKFQQPKPVE